MWRGYCRRLLFSDVADEFALVMADPLEGFVKARALFSVGDAGSSTSMALIPDVMRLTPDCSAFESAGRSILVVGTVFFILVMTST